MEISNFLYFHTIILLFVGCLKENKLNQKFEDLSVDNLAQLLRQFYGTVLSKNGKEYSKSGMINLRSGLNCYLHAPPYNKSYDLMNDRIFTQANLVFTKRLKDKKKKALIHHHPVHLWKKRI